MEEAIKNKTPIFVDLNPNRDAIYAGVPLKLTEEVFIMVSYDDQLKKYDGYNILRTEELTQFRPWDNKELLEIENDNLESFANKLPLDKMNSFYDCLNRVKNRELIAIYTIDDIDSYLVGKVTEINKKEITMKLINEKSKWDGYEKIPIDEITYIGFDTEYEKQLIAGMKK
jgi:hypothetical protein